MEIWRDMMNGILIDKTDEYGCRRVEYRSNNGYTGIMYGEKSFAIRDRKTDMEVLHTGSRGFNNVKDLVDQVEHFPEFLKILSNVEPDDWEDLDDDF